MHKYKLLGRKGEGTFSEVLKAQSIKTGKFMAIKCMKHVFESIEQVNSLREIQALRRLSPHPNIVKLHEVLYDQPTGRLALVFELMDCNIYELIKGRTHYLPEETVKIYMYQLMKAVDHMHRHGIFHRDIKPENLLIVDNMLKLADFGSCRGIYSKQPYTEYISTRWYRAPECLLTDGYYGYKMDLWGVGCVMFETLALYPLFPGTNEADQIERIHKISGTPSGEILEKFKHYGSTHVDFNFNQYKRHPLGLAKLLPHVSPDAIDLMHKLLLYDPDERMTAREALRHPWFSELRAAEKRQREAAKARKTGGTEGENKEGEDNEGKDNTDTNNNRTKDDDDQHSAVDSAADSPGNTEKQKAHKDGSEKKSKDAEVSVNHIGPTGANLSKELSPTKEISVTTNGGGSKPIQSSHSGNSGGKSGGGMNSNSRNPGGLQTKDSTGATLQYQIQGMKITGAAPSKSGGDNTSSNPKLSTKTTQSTSTNKATDNISASKQPVKRKDNDTLYENNTNSIDASKSLYSNNMNNMRSPQGNNLQAASVISYAGVTNNGNAIGNNSKGTNNKGPGGVLYGNSNPSGSLSPQGSNQYLNNGIASNNIPNPSLLNNNNNSPTLGRSNKYGPSATNVIAAAKSEVIGINGGASLYGMPMANPANSSANLQNINGLFKSNSMLSPGNNPGNPLLIPGGGNRQPNNSLLSPQQLASNPLLSSPMGLMPNTMNNSLSYGSNGGVQVLSPQPGNSNSINPLLLQHQQLQQMNLSPLRGNVPINPGLYGAMNNPAAAALVAAQQQAALAAASVSTTNNTSGNNNKYSTNTNSMKSKNSSTSTNQLLSPQYASNSNKYASNNNLNSSDNNKNRSSTNVPSFSFEQPSLYARRPEEKAGARNSNISSIQQGSLQSNVGSSSGPAQQLSFNRNNSNTNAVGRSNNEQFNRVSGTSASGGSGTKPSNTNNNSSSNISNHLKRASDIYITGNKSSNTSNNPSTNTNLTNSSVYDANNSSSTGKNSNVRNTNNTGTTTNNLLYGSSIPNNTGNNNNSNNNNNLLVNYLGNPPPPGGYSLYGNNVSTNTNTNSSYPYNNNPNIPGGVSLYGSTVDNNNSSGKWDVPRRRQGDKVRPLAPLYASPTSITTNAATGTTNPSTLPNTTNRSTNPPNSNNASITTVTNTNQPLTVSTGTVLSPLQQNNNPRYLSPYSQKVGEAKRF